MDAWMDAWMDGWMAGLHCIDSFVAGILNQETRSEFD